MSEDDPTADDRHDPTADDRNDEAVAGTDRAPADGEEESNESERGIVGRAWRTLVDAGRWVADTFRGHSDAQALKDRKR